MAYATLTELRALPDLSDTATYSDSLLNEAIAYATELIDGYCGAFFEPKPFTGAEAEPGPYAASLRITDMLGVQSITAASDHKGTALDVSGWTVDYDRQIVWAPAPIYDCDLRVSGVACVTPSGCPMQLRWAARTIASQYAKDLYSRIPDRALSLSTDMGQMNLAQAGGNGRPTNMPDVNAVLNRFRFGSPIVS